MTPPDITVLMPTYNRSDFTKRALAFLKGRFNQDRILFRMLDGSSDDAHAEANKKYCQDAGMEYKRYPADILPYNRIYMGLCDVETPLVALLPDDDMLNPTGFMQAIDFLLSHPDYSCAHGDYIGFRVSETNHKLEWWPGYKKNRSFEQKDPLDRLFDYFGNYTAVHYAVHRSERLKTSFAEVLAHVDPLEYKFAEYLIAGIAVSQGKVKKVNAFYMARQADVSTPYERTTMAQQMFDPRFSDRYGRFKNSLMRFCETSLEPENLSQAIDVVFGHFLGTWLQPFYLKNRLWRIQRDDKMKKQHSTPASLPTKQPQIKDVLYYCRRIRQAVRHPKRLIKMPNGKLYSPRYTVVLDFLNHYAKQPLI